MLPENLVCLTKINGCRDLEKLKTSLQTLLKPFGGIKNIFSDFADEKILIKPNLVAPVNFEQGATTNPFLVRALVELLFDKLNNPQILVGDGASVGQDTEEAFEVCGFKELLQGSSISYMNIKLVDIKQEEFIPYQVKKGRVFQEIFLPSLLQEIDHIINIPVLKTHDVFPATLGLKNLKGLIREQEKKLFHQTGLADAIVDLNLCLADLPVQIFTIYDGSIAMEGYGPVDGTPVNFELLGAAANIAAGDTVLSRCMGIKPEEIHYLTSASSRGLAPERSVKLEIRGEKLKDVSRSFSLLKLKDNFYQQHRINLIDRGGCSGCRHLLDNIISSWSAEEISQIAGHTIYLGPDGQDINNNSSCIKLGTCTKNLDVAGLYIPGCPPHPEIIKDYLL